jgi:hypothetical protein
VEDGRPPEIEVPEQRARRQLGRVLVVLGLLDLSAVVLVLVLALFGPFWGLSPIELLAAILGGAGFIVGTRIWLAVRLRRRSGELGGPKPH